MQLTDQHKDLQRSLSKFIEQEINPHVDAWEAEGMFPAHELFKKMGNQGFLGVCKPEEYGGMGLDYSYSVVMAETLGEITCGGVPMAIGVQTDMATPALAKFGSDALKEEFLIPTVAGDQVVCLGVSEPHAGSDVAAIRTTAVEDGDDLIINGGKMWTTNGLQADWMCLLAITSDDGNAHTNKSLMCMPMNLPGVTKSEKFDKMGMRSSDTCQVFLENVRIPKRNIIGQTGMGFTYQMLQFQEERLYGAANSLRMMDRAIADTIQYTSDRAIFGRSVLDFQTVHFRIAELKTEIECLRALVYRATESYIRGENVTELATMAKLKAGRLAREVADSCLQFWGGMGFMEETSINRIYRDARLLSIGAGADEVMLGILCKLMNTLPKKKKA